MIPPLAKAVVLLQLGTVLYVMMTPSNTTTTTTMGNSPSQALRTRSVRNLDGTSTLVAVTVSQSPEATMLNQVVENEPAPQHQASKDDEDDNNDEEHDATDVLDPPPVPSLTDLKVAATDPQAGSMSLIQTENLMQSVSALPMQPPVIDDPPPKSNLIMAVNRQVPLKSTDITSAPTARQSERRGPSNGPAPSHHDRNANRHSDHLIHHADDQISFATPSPTKLNLNLISDVHVPRHHTKAIIIADIHGDAYNLRHVLTRAGITAPAAFPTSHQHHYHDGHDATMDADHDPEMMLPILQDDRHAAAKLRMLPLEVVTQSLHQTTSSPPTVHPRHDDDDHDDTAAAADAEPDRVNRTDASSHSHRHSLGPLKWTGGNTTLVQLGDMVDRGPQSLAVLTMLMQLAADAKHHGGTVVNLLGNHEIWLMCNQQWGYFHRQEMKTHGGHQRLKHMFSPHGTIGSRLRTLPLAYRLNSTIFVHAGIEPHLARWMKQRNLLLQDQDRIYWDGDCSRHSNTSALLDGPHSIIFSRRLTRNTSDACSAVGESLRTLNATHMVVGHTPAPGGMRRQCGGRITLADTGMSSELYNWPAYALMQDNLVHRNQT